MAVFKKLREDLEIGLGCVSVAPGQVDSAETIVKRVEQALQFLAPERITLNPDCGFAPGSGAVVSMAAAYQKLRNEVAAGPDNLTREARLTGGLFGLNGFSHRTYRIGIAKFPLL